MPIMRPHRPFCCVLAAACKARTLTLVFCAMVLGSVWTRAHEMKDDKKSATTDPVDRVSPSVAPRQSLVFCYFRGSSAMRLGDGYLEFDFQDPDHLFPKICTHLIYSHAAIDERTGEVLKPADGPEFEMGKEGLYAKIRKLRESNRHLRVLISFGGPAENSTLTDDGEFQASPTASYRFHTMRAVVSSAEKRKNFTSSAASFLKKHGFDGLDIDFPTDFSANMMKDKKGLGEAVENLDLFLKGLKETLTNQSLLLSAAVSFSLAWDKPSLLAVARNVDYLTIKAYGYHGITNGTTGHSAPHPQVVRSTLEFLEHGVPRQNLIIGMSLFATGYKLAVKDRKAGPGAISRGPLVGRHADLAPGTLSYEEVCNFINDGVEWRLNWDAGQESFHLIDANGTRWISFENEETLHYKVRFVQKQNLAGITVWSVDGDDLYGSCGGGRAPLLNAIELALKTPPGGGIYGR